MKSRSRSLGLETVSRRCFGTSRFHLGLEKMCEGLGLGLGLVWNRKLKVSVSGLNVSFYKLIFIDISSLKLVPVIRLSVNLHGCFSHHRLVKVMYYQASALQVTYIILMTSPFTQ